MPRLSDEIARALFTSYGDEPTYNPLMRGLQYVYNNPVEAARAAGSYLGRTAVENTREIMSGLGGGLGAVGGLVSPVPGDELALAIAGSSLGSSIGGTIEDALKVKLGWAPPEQLPQTVGQGVVQSLENAATGAMEEVGGRGIGAIVGTGAGLLGKYAPFMIGGVKTWTETGKKRLSELAAKVEPGVDFGALRKFINDADSVAARMVEQKHLLDRDRGLYSAVRANADPQYRESIDFSTLCKKRRPLQEAIEAEQMRLGRGLTADEFMDVRRRLKEAGETVSCGPCYVESQRMRLGDVANQFIEKYPELDKRYFLTQDGIDDLMTDFPEIYREWRATLGARGIKTPETYAEYDHQILNWNKARIDRVNKQPGGLRWFSWSDFEPQHLLDGMQVIADMSVRGLKGHAYTKSPEFVELFGDTGLMINMSLIPSGNTGISKAGRRLEFDDIEGFPAKKAFELRKKYPKNVGTILIGISDDQIRMALRDPRIDYVIPYHSSGMSLERRTRHGFAWKDYTSVQKEKVVDPVKNKESGGIDTVFFEEWMGDRDKYLELCAERGLSPAFPQFLNEPNYWKLHADIKRQHNGEWIRQEPVKPNFDAERLNKFMRSKFPATKTKHKQYYRATLGPNPAVMGFAMFADDAEAVSHFGRYRWRATDEGAVDIEDIANDLGRLFKEHFDEIDHLVSRDTTPEDLVEFLNPENIVSDAGIWDNDGLVSFIWHRYLEPNDITKVKTRDGLLVFDPEQIKRSRK